jgi:hypothetical protein
MLLLHKPRVTHVPVTYNNNFALLYTWVRLIPVTKLLLTGNATMPPARSYEAAI